ncbi:unnamed protein product [Brachionus calyciflorus]|uniref:Vacuolar protein-sorting-associated protein 25 n=1 Tax=Brachionus calyciflorus TaxID=104777 RepID=A0A813R4N3_9BILA|nr:unnamed protein product [Brachionus calyciflorus]
MQATGASTKTVNENVILKNYEKKVKEEVRLINENLFEMLKLLKIDDSSKSHDDLGLNKNSQAEIDSFEIEIRTSNLVKSTESLSKIVSDLKDLTILNDFKSINSQITNHLDFPWQYNFPPFFTLQPNEDTKRKQLDAWCDLVLNYCKFKRIYQLDLNEAQNTELFSNKKLDRKCSLELISVILDQLVKANRAEWVMSGEGKNVKKTTKCFIYWFSLDEWAKLLYEYVNKNSLQNTVCTIYELIDGDEVRKEPFYKLDRQIFFKNSEPGVKFF